MAMAPRLLIPFFKRPHFPSFPLYTSNRSHRSYHFFFSFSLSLSLSLFRLFDSEIGPEIVLFSLLDRLFFSSSLKFYQFCIVLLETLRQFLWGSSRRICFGNIRTTLSELLNDSAWYLQILKRIIIGDLFSLSVLSVGRMGWGIFLDLYMYFFPESPPNGSLGTGVTILLGLLNNSSVIFTTLFETRKWIVRVSQATRSRSVDCYRTLGWWPIISR